jgi:WD40 repeat protein
MTTTVGRRFGVAWLCVACLGLTLSPLAAQEPKLRDTLKGHTHVVAAVVFSPDGKTLASGSSDKTIRLWDVATSKEQATLKGSTEAVMTLAFSPDGKTLASGCQDTTITLWDVATGKEQATLKGHTHSVSSVAFSPDGQTLASGGWDKSVKLWSVAMGNEQGTSQPQGTRTRTLKLRHTLKGHADIVWRVAMWRKRATPNISADSPSGSALPNVRNFPDVIACP